MKKDLLIVPTYIFVTLFFTVILAVFFVLYPLPTIGTLDYTTYVVDVFLYATLSLLPMVAVLSLVFVILRTIKLGNHTMLSFLTYIFLCLFVWLLLIPLFLFFSPEKNVSFFITGQTPSLATIFFYSDSLIVLSEYLEIYQLRISNSILTIFSDILLLRDTAIVAGKNGRIEYLIFSSLGLALSGLYALRFVSKWKLINVATILFLWTGILWINAQMHSNGWTLYLSTKWTVFVCNAIVFFICMLIGFVTSTKRRIHRKKEGA